jgi:hypothetical protein
MGAPFFPPARLVFKTAPCTMDTQTAALRALARRYLEISALDRYRAAPALHRAVNDNRMVRPVVLIDELPWHELNADGSLTNVCEDDALREAEIYLRRMLHRHRHFPADMSVPARVPVRKIARSSGIGLAVDETNLVAGAGNHILSHEYHDRLADERALDKLHPPVITYDRDETLRRWQRVGDAIGDILPVRLAGFECFYTSPWDDISRYRGVEPLLLDLAERPDYSHRMIARFAEFELERLRQCEALGLLDPDPERLHCTCAAVTGLPRPDAGAGAASDADSARTSRLDIWGRGMAQIFASASPAMRDEFDIAYMKDIIGACGLAYYGCCEPLDKCIEVVAKIPNLRKVTVTPWADPRAAAEAIAGRFVVSAKPNPAALAVERLDRARLRDELNTLLGACRDHGCSCELVLKDISTCHHRPENIIEWEQTAMELAGAH